MTDERRLELLRDAREHLHATQIGFVEYQRTHRGSEWRAAERLLDRLERELAPDPVPSLGPVVRGGRSLLNVSLTHNTDGISLYPAFDDGWVAGREAIAPEDLVVVSPYTSANPGAAFYALGVSGLRYWFGHLTASPRIGTHFARGYRIGVIAQQHTPHVHTGVNAEKYLGAGRQLLYGRTGRGPDYTTGSPTIGAQLRKALEV